MVRQLALESLYRKQGSSISPENESVQNAVAFIWAISKETHDAPLTSLSKVALPFWIVQTSPENSIILSACGSSEKKIEFVQESRLAEVRRRISADINEPQDIPAVVDAVLVLMDEMSTEHRSIQNLHDPEPFAEVGALLTEIEPGHSPNRVEETFGSQKALAESEAFQRIRDELLARVERMEELQTLVKDKLIGQLKVVENIVELEKRRWDERVTAARSTTEMATHDLELKKSSELYSLKEEYRRKLRAKTAEFARASTDIESYFTYLLDHVRETRVSIAQKQDDVESAIDEYQKLAKYLTDALPRFEEILEALNEKSAEVLAAAKEHQEALATKSTETMVSVDSEIDQQKSRVERLEVERKQKEAELDALIEDVKSAIDRIQGRVRKRLLEHQSDVLNLQRNTLKNEAIKGIAPLTHLDVFIFVVQYANGHRELFTPGVTPTERFGLPADYQWLSERLDSHLRSTIDALLNDDTSFPSRFESAITTGNIFQDPENFDLIERGLRDLQMRQLFEEGAYERIARLLKRCMGISP